MSLPDLSSPYPVSPRDVAAFGAHGHVLLRGVASRQEVEFYRSAITGAVESQSADRIPLEERDRYGKAFLQIMNLWRRDPAVAGFVQAPRFARIAAQLLGVQRVRLYHDQALFKEPGGGFTPWHQDAMHWPLDGSRCLTMWMPLVDITTEMGALTFASGSHVAGPLSDITLSDASEECFEDLLSDGRYPSSDSGVMASGDATFHSGWTVHRAPGNSSDQMRSVMTVIWFADGLPVQEPVNAFQEFDLESWLPGRRPGEPAATDINPVL